MWLYGTNKQRRAQREIHLDALPRSHCAQELLVLRKSRLRLVRKLSAEGHGGKQEDLMQASFAAESQVSVATMDVRTCCLYSKASTPAPGLPKRSRM